MAALVKRQNLYINVNPVYTTPTQTFCCLGYHCRKWPDLMVSKDEAACGKRDLDRSGSTGLRIRSPTAQGAVQHQ